MIIILFLVVVLLIGWQVYKRRQNDNKDTEEGIEKTIMVGVANPVYSDAQ